MKYKQMYDGDWIRPKHRGYLERCCDCGLVHRFNFRINRGQVMYQPFRDVNRTRASRRTKKYAGLILPTSKRKR